MKKKIDWSDPALLESFEKLKELITGGHHISLPTTREIASKLELHTDASNFCVGSHLSQWQWMEVESGERIRELRTIGHYSCMLNRTKDHTISVIKN